MLDQGVRIRLCQRGMEIGGETSGLRLASEDRADVSVIALVTDLEGDDPVIEGPQAAQGIERIMGAQQHEIADEPVYFARPGGKARIDPGAGIGYQPLQPRQLRCNPGLQRGFTHISALSGEAIPGSLARGSRQPWWL